jgi:hypothetical protein|tara:strand:- start:4033 stop:4893 length:861 start_codon:yes stop_codon:yes gene_type:complete
MATVGLKGIWGLEQLDRTGIATWKLGILLMGGGVLMGVLLSPILGEVNQDSVMASFYTPRVVSLTLVVAGLYVGLSVFVTLVLARTTEADLRLLPLTDDGVTESLKRLQPSTGTLLSISIVLMMAIIAMLPVLRALRLNITIVESFSAIHSSGLVLNVIVYGISPIVGLVNGIMFAIFISQFLSLIHTARRMKVDLLQLNHYSAIANPAVRLSLFLLALFSLWPLMMLYVSDPRFSSGMTSIALIMMLAISPILILYFYPVLILRNRIRDEKQKELNAVPGPRRHQ